MKKTTNNKGFSLIELIIVIAIMAVLVAVIAPNLTKYLGSSKKSTDTKNLDEIASTVNTCITDFEMNNSTLIPDDKTTATAAAGNTIELTWSKAADGTISMACTAGTDTALSVAAAKTAFEGIVNTAIDASKTESKEKSGTCAKVTITKDHNTKAYNIKAEFPTS